MILTKKQKEALPYVKWLFHGPRREGRTVTIIAAAIVHALENPGVRVNVLDHYPRMDVQRMNYLYFENIFCWLLADYPKEIKEGFKIYRTHGFQVCYDNKVFEDSLGLLEE